MGREVTSQRRNERDQLITGQGRRRARVQPPKVRKPTVVDRDLDLDGPHWVSTTPRVLVAGLDLGVADPLLFDDRDWGVEPEDAACCTTGLPLAAVLSVEVW